MNVKEAVNSHKALKPQNKEIQATVDVGTWSKMKRAGELSGSGSKHIRWTKSNL